MNSNYLPIVDVQDIRSAEDKTQMLREELPCRVDVGNGYMLHVLGYIHGDRKFYVTNPQTNRKGFRDAADIYRSMRDRSKLKVMDSMRALNRDVTAEVVGIQAGRI